MPEHRTDIWKCGHPDCSICGNEKPIQVSRKGLERLQRYIILGEYPKAIGMLSTILVQGVDSDTAS